MGNSIPHKWLQIILGLVLSQYISCDCLISILDFHNGRITSPNLDLENRTEVEELTILQFTCFAGYSLIGDEFLQCLDDEWTSAEPFCAGRKCSDPPFVENAAYVLNHGVDTDPVIGSLAEYSCNIGYKLAKAGKAFLQCKLSREFRMVLWEGEKPVCKEVFCHSPPPLNHGTIPELQTTTLIKFPYGFEISYKCDEGYEMFGGDSRGMCSHRGVWFGVAPICEEKLSCDDPGSSVDGDREGDCCSTGDTLLFTCNDGYDLVGNAEIRCLRSGVWTAKRPLCRPLNSDYCEFPAAIPNGILRGRKKGDYFIPGEEAKVVCKTGSKEKGPVFNECEKGGKWAEEFGVCEEIFCDPPPPLAHGTIPELQKTNLTKFRYNFEINYICDKGYLIDGGDSWSTCNSRGLWSGDIPHCKFIQCPEPGTPEYGMKSSSNYSVGSRVRYRCFPGTELLGSEEIICQPNGHWIGEPARCNTPSNYCPDPGTPIRGSKTISGYNMGDRVSFRCEPQTILLGSVVRECLPNRDWSGTPAKCAGPYDFDNSAQVRDLLLFIIAEMREQHRKEIEWSENARNASGYMLGRMLDLNHPERLVLYFVFDVSRRIGESNFKKSIAFAKYIVKKTGVSEKGVRVGVLTFASRTEIIFVPLLYNTTEDVLDALDKIEYTGGGTTSGSPLLLIREECVPLVQHYLGNKIKSVVFLLTDGRATKKENLKNDANMLKAAGVEIYCIGITGNAKREVLNEIASRSLKSRRPNVFILHDYHPLDWFVKDIINGTAEILCDKPPPLEHGVIPELQMTNLLKFPSNFEINYVCNEGYRIFGGDSWRMCNRTGDWSGETPHCEIIACPDPGTPENGEKTGSNSSVGSRVSFRCFRGYELLGAEKIVCQSNGQWKGELARCNKPSNYCPDPGTPIRGSKNMSEYNMGDTVRFFCKNQTTLLGSEVRECLPNGTWSGEPASCVGLYDFDNSAQVRNILLGKINEMKEQQGNELKRSEESRNASSSMLDDKLDLKFPERIILYFAFDVSSNTTLSSFKKSITFAKSIVKKVGVTEHGIRVGAVTFASKAESIFFPMHYETTEDVLDALDKIEYFGEEKSFTSALTLIGQELIPLTENAYQRNEVKSVIFILTDGKANNDEGISAESEAYRLKTAGVEIYCIGTTGNIRKKFLIDIASKSKYGEDARPNVFLLYDYRPLDWYEKITNGIEDYSVCGLRSKKVGNNRARIVGGKRSRDPWPWMAALYFMRGIQYFNPERTLQCGGSIIHQYFVLTAAHCLSYNFDDLLKSEEITVKLGLTDRSVTTHLQEMRVRKIHVHPRFNPFNYDNDIALLELRTPIDYNAFVRPICLPPKEIPEDSPFYKPQSIVWITGWGHVNKVRKGRFPQTLSPYLKEIALPIQHRETCMESLRDDDYAEHFTDRMFCAGTGGEKNDTCGGDSGGPVMQPFLNEAGKISWTQVGVVSWGLGCGLEGEYGIYVHLQKLMPWIEDTIEAALKWMGD